ncbi:hypothetical protein THASP1DRAFT_31281 [Thamnocephalis sphaerospora]|uniref:Uncharacterized protein n=1 Tax=Thamnocephalis sphaerospora TaxID=78915 RepID=A0A4P9XLY9_9FUNG|nr:hypothetical protein THASP1DRAFT_31281 [Thamnocephalis sphaerospora]|eukprot:RKP06908.1 hypothetical protein THASP1DRAFT_31281 [Thamnocephalis sphaerospora]
MESTTITHTPLERVLHALPSADRYSLLAQAGFHATLAIAGSCRSLSKLLTDNALWQAIYQHDFMPTMQKCEAQFLNWCLRTATRLTKAEGDTLFPPRWAMLDWRDTYRRRVCTERNWKQGRYIRRVYTFPQLSGYRSRSRRIDGWTRATVHASAAAIHFLDSDGRDRPTVNRAYALDDDCVPNTEQERSELQRELDTQSPALLNLVYFNYNRIRNYNEPKLFEELRAQLRQHRGQYPHLDAINSAIRHAIGEEAGQYDYHEVAVLWDCWITFIVNNEDDSSDIIACNILYRVIRKEPLNIALDTIMTVIRTLPKSIIIYMAGLDEKTKNMRWRLLEIFTNRPTKIICSGVVRLHLDAECRLDRAFPIVDRGSKRVDRVGVSISLGNFALPPLYDTIVHDISATTVADTPVSPLLRESAHSYGPARLPGGFAFIQDNQLVCSVDCPTQRTKVNTMVILENEPLLGYIFSASRKFAQDGCLQLLNGQDGTWLPFRLRNYSVPYAAISSHATGLVRVIHDWKAIEVYSFGAE